MRRLVVALISLYQRTISPDHGWFSGGKQRVCRYYPTCSEYTREAVERFGIWRGLGKGLWRIIRCNPFSRGGYDPVERDGSNKRK